MAEIHEIIDNLCKQKGITGYKMCSDLGLSKSMMTELRKGRAKSLKVETASKIAKYFDVSVEYLLGNAAEEQTFTSGLHGKTVFYDIYFNLCKSKNVLPSKAAEDNGLSRTSVVKWKNGVIPSGATLQKLALYFNVPLDFLLGKEEQKEKPDLNQSDELTFDDFTYALHNESKELTEENKQKLLEMARLFKLSQDAEKNK